MLDHFLELITNREPFAFTRLGDGDWETILWDWPPGRAPANCDGARYSPSMRQEFIRLLQRRPDYYLGRTFGERLEAKGNRWLREQGLQDLKWSGAGVWARAILDNRMPEVIQALASRQLVLIGPRHLQHLVDVLPKFPVVESIYTHPVEAFERRDTILKESLAAADRWPDAVFCFCAGPATEVVLDEMYQRTRELTLVDLGSFFDGLCGVYNRSHHSSPAAIREHYHTVRAWSDQ